MRHTIAVAALMFVMAVGLVMPANAGGVNFIPTFIFSLVEDEVETHYLARFVGERSGELFPSGNILRPQSGEKVTCQVLQLHAGPRLRDFTFRYAKRALPERVNWRSFVSDPDYGHIGDLGAFFPNPEGLATPLRFMIDVRKGVSREIRIFGFKEPITNAFLSLFGLSKDDLIEYQAIYVLPCEPTPDSPAPAAVATAVIDGSQFADAEATYENLCRIEDAFGGLQQRLIDAIGRINLNMVPLAEGIQANGTAIANLEARVSALEACVEPLENIEVLVVPTSSLQRPVSVERCNFRINLPRGVVTRVETLDERGSRVYDRRYAGYIPMNNYSVGQTLAVRLTWEGRGSDQWKVVRSVRPNMVVNYSEMEVR